MSDYLERELLNNVTLRDINYHFELKDSHYQVIIDFVSSSTQKQAIDEFLRERGNLIRDIQYKKQRQIYEERVKKE